MDYRIEHLDTFKLMGYHIRSTNSFMKGMRDCPAFWKKMIKENKPESLLPFMSRQPFGLIGASVYNVDETDSQKFDYYIAVATNSETPANLTDYLVPAMTWAVFPCTLKTNRQTQLNIVRKWAPKSDYQLLNSGYQTGKMLSVAPDLEVYGSGDEVEIWVPVAKKEVIVS